MVRIMKEMTIQEESESEIREERIEFGEVGGETRDYGKERGGMEEMEDGIFRKEKGEQKWDSEQ